MLISNPSYTVTLRVALPVENESTTNLMVTIAKANAQVSGVDVVESEENKLIVNVTFDARDDRHVKDVCEAIETLPGAEVIRFFDATFDAHLHGKIGITIKEPIRTRQDLSRVYTPGVARVCSAIAKDKSKARHLTIKANTVAVVTDGTAVLGIGDIGPEAAMPVMEGKAALFKQFGNVDAWPVCLDTKDTEEIIQIVKAISPGYGGINLEDISAPRCFEIEERLREELDIPVFHDDQHGTAIVVLAAIINALRVVNKKIEDVRIVVSGVGAAGSAIIRILLRQGAKHIIGFGRAGALGPFRQEDNKHRNWIATHTNEEGFQGTLAEGLEGADVFIGVSAGNILTGDDIAKMNKDAIVFALANPQPEVDPIAAAKHAAVVATGRSDYPNQINNVLVFPGLFRGLLDAGAKEITDSLMTAAAVAVADVVGDHANASYIIPNVFDERVAKAVAEAVCSDCIQEENTGL